MFALSHSLSVALIAAACAGAAAAVRLPMVFSHHMVLQRDVPAPVWGTAAPGERVTVRFLDQRHEATADAAGAWRITLAPLGLGEPGELTVEGSQTPEPWVAHDVAIGDLWVCSGQSNMEWSVEMSRDGDLDLAAADRPAIRLLQVNQLGAQEDVDDVDRAWAVCSSDSLRSFSAVGYHFGAQLHETLGVPVGLIRNAWGGSACEAWVPLAELRGNPLYRDLLASWSKREANHDEPALRADYAAKLVEFYSARDAAYAAGQPLPERPWVANPLFHQHRPANMFHGRVAPLTPFAIKGVIWYQGETNVGRAAQYRDLFPRMIRSWREAWGQGDFPFYWVQLADFQAEAADPGAPSPWAELREAQTHTAKTTPNTGEAVIIDLGEANDIHPRNKRDVGLRLARLALAKTYGRDVKGTSPTLESAEFGDGVATLTVADIGAGLQTFDGAPACGFALAGEDRVFHTAEAQIAKGENRVVLSSPSVPKPVAARYGWADNPEVNVFDSAWLPLTPFRTDDWPRVREAPR